MNAATISVLLAKGLSGVDILEVAQAMEAAAPRSSNAERQARYRERRRNGSNVTANVTPAPNDKDILTPTLIPVISNEITAPPALKPDHVLEAYNAVAVRAGLPHASMTAERRKKLSRFVRRHSAEQISAALAAMEQSAFCRGDNDRGWKADFDFLLQPKSFTRLVEGFYGSKPAPPAKIELTAQQLRERAEWFVRHGQPDRADECRQKAVKLEQRAVA